MCLCGNTFPGSATGEGGDSSRYTCTCTSMPSSHLISSLIAEQELLAALEGVALKHKVSISNVALRWVLDQPAVGGAIVVIIPNRLYIATRSDPFPPRTGRQARLGRPLGRQSGRFFVPSRSRGASYLPAYLPTYLPTFLPTYLHSYQPTFIPTFLPTYLPTYLPSLIISSRLRLR